MSLIENAKQHVRQVADVLTDKVADAATRQGRTQAITIGRSREEVMALFQDVDRLSVIFGDLVEVAATSPDRMRWKFLPHNGAKTEWECAVVTEDEHRIRFVDVYPNRHAGIVLDFRDAPQSRGTEVIDAVGAPAPGALTGALAFKALYRARALLMTDEVPTIKRNPSARESDR